MANSLNFLNKPASPSPGKLIGPQPKPSTPAAPKAFLDKANPWAVGGGSTPAPKTPAPKTPAPKTPAPKTQTPARTATPVASSARAPVQAAVARSTPEPRQAAPARAATRPLPQPAPTPIQMIAPRATPSPAPAIPWQMAPTAEQAMAMRPTPAPAYVNPYLAQQQGADYRLQPAPVYGAPDAYVRQQQGADYPYAAPAPVPASPWQMAPTAEQAMAMRPTPTPTRPTPTQQPAQPWQMAPTAEQAMAARSMPQPRQLAPTAEQAMAMRPPAAPAPEYSQAPTRAAIPSTGYNYTDAPPGMTSAAPAQPAAPTTPANVTQPEATGPFYGYAPPGPLTARPPVIQQRGQLPFYTAPAYTQIGQRALMSDAAIAAEDAKRQRDAAGGFGALQMSGRFRPWSSYSPAEKYYLRYGVMPEGAQIAPDTSGADALAANEAQNARLYDEYWDRYRNVIRGRRWYGGTRPGQQETMYGTEMAAAIRGNVQPAAQSTATTATTPANPAQAAQIARNNQMVLQVNPQAATTGVTEQDANTVAREIAKRYMPDKDVSTLTLADIGAMLALSYTPPPGLEQQFGYDMDWLSQFLPSE